MDYSLRIAAIIEGREKVKQLTSDVKVLRQEYDRIKQLDIKGAFESPEGIRALKEQRRISGEIVDSVDKTIQLEKTGTEQTRKKLLHQIKLNSAIRLFERRQKQTFSTGARDLKQYSGAIEDIEKAFSFFKKEGDVSGIKALAEEMGRINEQQRETTRQTGQQQLGTAKIVDYQKQINKFKSAGLNTSKAQRALDNFSTVAGTKQVGLSSTKEKLLQRRIRSLKEETAELNKQAAIEESRIAAQRSRFETAISSAMIGGGFPMLFGQGGATAAGGAIGGFAGGLMGGAFGFALSIVGSAIGQAVEESEKFNKSLAEVNAKAAALGLTSKATAKDIENLAKQLGTTKDEALEIVGAFSAFESFADKKALAAIFGDDAGAFNRLAAVKTEFDLAKQIFDARDDIGNLEAARLINMLKITDASTVELALAEARLQAEHDISVEKARQITLMDRAQAIGAVFAAAGPGGLLTLLTEQGDDFIEKFGEDRVKELEDNFVKNRDKFLETLKKLLADRRDLLADVASFDPGKDPTAAESGESIEQRLRKQLAQYEQIDPFVRKRAVVEADHLVTLEKIAKVKDEIKRKDLEILAGQVKQARLDDIKAQKAEKALRERLSAAKTLASLEMRLATAQANLPGAFSGAFGGSQRTAALGQQKIDFELQQRNLEIEDAVTRGLTERADKLKASRDQYELYETQILNATVAQQQFNEALALTQPVTDSLFDSLMAVADGTKSAQEAFADFLRSIASMLVDTAKQMIAQYIAIGVARMFSGIPSGETNIHGSNVTEVLQSGNLYNPANSPFAQPRALGGAVGAGRPYMVGERGPELFVPGAQGNIVPNNAMGGSNIVVNVDASGSSVEGNADQASQLGKAIGIAVQQELVKQKRPGGLLAS